MEQDILVEEEIFESEIEVEEGVIQLKPTLEKLEVNPTSEKQIFKSSSSAYDEVVVNPVLLQEKTVFPETQDKTIIADTNYTGLKSVKVNKATASIDNNIKSENIKKGVSILEVEGTLEAGVIEPKLTDLIVTPTTSLQRILPTEEYDGFSRVTVSAVTNEIDSNIQADNIKEGVSILGVTGNLKEGGGGTTPSGAKGIIINECDSNGYALSVSVKGITNIPEYYFGNSNGLTQKLQSVELSNEVVSFSNNAFRGNASVVSVNIPPKVTKISNGCFRGCSNLQMSVIPANVTYLDNTCFQECLKMTNVTILGDITYLGNGAFYRITNLEKLILPNVTSVVPLGGTSVLTNTKIEKGTGYVYVPDHLVDGYKASWTAVANQIKGISEL